MYCGQCGTKLPDDAKFCIMCGVKTDYGTKCEKKEPMSGITLSPGAMLSLDVLKQRYAMATNKSKKKLNSSVGVQNEETEVDVTFHIVASDNIIMKKVGLNPLPPYGSTGTITISVPKGSSGEDWIRQIKAKYRNIPEKHPLQLMSWGSSGLSQVDPHSITTQSLEQYKKEKRAKKLTSYLKFPTIKNRQIIQRFLNLTTKVTCNDDDGKKCSVESGKEDIQISSDEGDDPPAKKCKESLFKKATYSEKDDPGLCSDPPAKKCKESLFKKATYSEKDDPGLCSDPPAKKCKESLFKKATYSEKDDPGLCSDPPAKKCKESLFKKATYSEKDDPGLCSEPPAKKELISLLQETKDCKISKGTDKVLISDEEDTIQDIKLTQLPHKKPERILEENSKRKQTRQQVAKDYIPENKGGQDTKEIMILNEKADTIISRYFDVTSSIKMVYNWVVAETPYTDLPAQFLFECLEPCVRPECPHIFPITPNCWNELVYLLPDVLRIKTVSDDQNCTLTCFDEVFFSYKDKE